LQCHYIASNIVLFALVAGSPEPANCGLATVVMWICGSYCERNKHHEEEAWPHFCCSILFPRSMHQPGYIQEGQEAIFGYLLLGVYYRNPPGCTKRCCYITVDPATPALWNGVSHFGVLLNRPHCLMLPSLKWHYSYKLSARNGIVPWRTVTEQEKSRKIST
jgi:hypothetical protein